MQTPSTREIADTEVRDEERHEIEHDEAARSPATRSARSGRVDRRRSATTRPSCWRATTTPSSSAGGSRSRPASSTSRVETVEQADELVAQVMKRVAEGFATERERLEQQWGRGEDVSTEDLRVTLQRYRGFFERLLAA